MHTGRVEAFSDGVIAIIITIMVLELKVPHEGEIHALIPLVPGFLSYTLSYIYLGIYWSNHHHLLHSATAIKGRDLWANLHLLFWLSLIPFVTAWMGVNHFTALPVAFYGGVLLMSAVSYHILSRSLVWHHRKSSPLVKAIGKDLKGVFSILIYAIAIGTAFWNPKISGVLYLCVALMWLVPDRRIEEKMEESEAKQEKAVAALEKAGTDCDKMQSEHEKAG